VARFCTAARFRCAQNRKIIGIFFVPGGYWVAGAWAGSCSVPHRFMTRRMPAPGFASIRCGAGVTLRRAQMRRFSSILPEIARCGDDQGRSSRTPFDRNPARAGPILTSKPHERFMFARLGGRIVADALRPLPCQKCHLTGVLAWLINATGKCDEGPASVSLHVRFRSTHAPAPVAQHPVWPGPLPLA
jgi:hypothetical protein